MPAMRRGKVVRCRVCGCTDDQACPDGCSWVAAQICSNPVCVATAIREMDVALIKIAAAIDQAHHTARKFGTLGPKAKFAMLARIKRLTKPRKVRSI